MKRKNKPTSIIIAGGGSGGHLFPGIAIAQELEAQLDSSIIYFIGSRYGIESRVFPTLKYRCFLLPISGLYKVGAIRKLLGLLRFAYSVVYTFFLTLYIRPHVVIGVGGYASGAAMLCGLLLRRNLVIQEQNASPGMTNRFLGKYAKLAFVPFSGMEKFFPNPVVVGNPIRKEILQVKAYTPQDKVNLLIVGGSQGCHAINMACIEALPILADLADQIRIIHQSGYRDYEILQDAYAKYPKLEAQVFPFAENMAELYSQSHLLLCRSGSIIHEIIVAGRGMLLVPFPNASGNHQLRNAEYIVEKQAGILLEQDEQLGEKLIQVLQRLLQNTNEIEEMAKQAKSLAKTDATKEISETILSFYKLK